MKSKNCFYFKYPFNDSSRDACFLATSINGPLGSIPITFACKRANAFIK